MMMENICKNLATSSSDDWVSDLRNSLGIEEEISESSEIERIVEIVEKKLASLFPNYTADLWRVGDQPIYAVFSSSTAFVTTGEGKIVFQNISDNKILLGMIPSTGSTGKGFVKNAEEMSGKRGNAIIAIQSHNGKIANVGYCFY
jgi:hypothetical protein